MNFDCASDHVLRQLIKFHLRVLRDLRGGEESSRLFLHWPKRQHSFTEQLIKHLREAGVNRGETAEDSFVTGEMFESGARVCVIAVGEEKEKNRQRAEYDLQSAVQPQRADKHNGGEQSPHGEICSHRGVV